MPTAIPHGVNCQRPYSIRTRIKTLPCQAGRRLPAQVRDHIPLEQGLRPALWRGVRVPCSVRDHIPLEQGLRLIGLSSHI